MGHVWWVFVIDLSLSMLALARSTGCHSDKQLHPQITAIIPPGIDQGLLFIQSLFISTELRPDTVLLLAFHRGSLVHHHPPLASQTHRCLKHTAVSFPCIYKPGFPCQYTLKLTQHVQTLLLVLHNTKNVSFNSHWSTFLCLFQKEWPKNQGWRQSSLCLLNTHCYNKLWF